MTHEEYETCLKTYHDKLARGKFKRTVKGIWYLIRYPELRQSTFELVISLFDMSKNSAAKTEKA